MNRTNGQTCEKKSTASSIKRRREYETCIQLWFGWIAPGSYAWHVWKFLSSNFFPFMHKYRGNPIDTNLKVMEAKTLRKFSSISDWERLIRCMGWRRWPAWLWSPNSFALQNSFLNYNHQCDKKPSSIIWKSFKFCKICLNFA